MGRVVIFFICLSLVIGSVFTLKDLSKSHANAHQSIKAYDYFTNLGLRSDRRGECAKEYNQHIQPETKRDERILEKILSLAEIGVNSCGKGIYEFYYDFTEAAIKARYMPQNYSQIMDLIERKIAQDDTKATCTEVIESMAFICPGIIKNATQKKG